MSARRRSTERGFTIIEMIVALFLFAVAMAVVMPALGNMLDLGNRGSANAQASFDSSYALQIVEADLRRAQAARGNSDLEQDTTSVVEALKGGPAMHDIVSAGPTTLQLYTDALGSSPGPELVTYQLRQQLTRSANGPCDRQAKRSWCILRSVQAGGTTLAEVIAHGTGIFPTDTACVPGSTTPTTRLFCYQHKVPAAPGALANRYAWNVWTPTCTASWGAPPAPAGNWNAATENSRVVPTYHDRLRTDASSIWTLDTISAIGIVLPAGGRTDGARGLTTSVTTVDLRNRSSEEYLSAIMCGAR